MASSFFILIGVFFSLRSLILLLWHNRSLRSRLWALFQLLLYFPFTFLLTLSSRSSILSLFEIHPWLFSLFVLMVAIALVYSLQRTKIRFSPFRLCCFHGLLLIPFLLVTSLSCLQTVFAGRSFAKIIIPGRSSYESVEWKLPYAKAQKNWLTTYQVILQDEKKENRLSAYFFGDLIGVRCKVIQLHPILYWMGFSNLYEIDCLFSDYLSLDKKRSFPSKQVEVDSFSNAPKWAHKMAWTLWESFFYQKLHLFFVKGGILETQYFPLVDYKGSAFKGSFDLRQSMNGTIISSLAQEEIL